MNELIKSIKLYSDAVILATATVAAFLVSPHLPDPYVKPKEELVALKAVILRSDQYRQHVAARLNGHSFPDLELAITADRRLPIPNAAPATAPAAAPQPPVESAPQPATCGDEPSEERAVSDAFSQIRVRVEFGKRPTETFDADIGGKSPRRIKIHFDEDCKVFATVSNRHRNTWGTALPFRVEVPSRYLTTQQAYEFLTRHENVGSGALQTFEPDPIDLGKKFRAALANFPNCELVSWRIVASPLESTEQPKSPCAGPGCVAGGVESCKLEMLFKVGDETVPLCTHSYGKWACASCAAVEVKKFLDWLKDTEIEEANDGKKDKKVESTICINALFTKDGVRTDWLPQSHLVWSTVATRHVDEAIVELERLSAAQRERISLFSLTASVTSAALAFPIAISVILWVCFLQLRSFREITTTEAELDKARHEWFGFLPGRMPFWTAIFLIDAAPVLTSVWLVSLLLRSKANWFDSSCAVIFVLTLLGCAITHGYNLKLARARRPSLGETEHNR